jgi:hypothetical protein
MVKIAYIMFRLNEIYPLNRSAAKWWSQNLEQNVTDVHEVLLLYPITILIYDPTPY